MKANIKLIIAKLIKYGPLGFIVAVFYKIYSLILVNYYSDLKLVYGLNQTEKRDKKVIVSLTSYPERFSTLHLCIKSLLRQSYKPDKIILYLGDDSAPESVSDNILSLLPFGLEIEHCTGNLKPHKKYFYSMQKYPDDIIITVDDDTLYKKNLVLSLVQSYHRHPNAVSARHVIKMLKDRNGKLVSSKEFLKKNRKEKFPSLQLIAIGVGGILYPPHCLPRDTFDVDAIINLCLNADDIWLKFMEIKKKVPVVWVPSYGLSVREITIPNTQGTALYLTNTGFVCKNDDYIACLSKYFSINLADYC